MASVRTVGKKSKNKSIVKIFRPKEGCEYSFSPGTNLRGQDHIFGVTPDFARNYPDKAQKRMRHVHEIAMMICDTENPEIIEVEVKFKQAQKFMKNARSPRMSGKKKSQYEPKSACFEGE